MRETAAENARKRFANFLIGGFWFFIEQRFRRQNYPAKTEAALCSLFIDESLLNRMRLFRCTQTFERDDLLWPHRAHWHYARATNLPLDENRASSTLGEAAAEFRSSQMQFVAEHVQERSFRIDLNGVRPAIDIENNGSHTINQIYDA